MAQKEQKCTDIDEEQMKELCMNVILMHLAHHFRIIFSFSSAAQNSADLSHDDDGEKRKSQSCRISI